MIENLHLKNFKAFHDIELNLKPITVVAGPNSSGKSSLIQALLLLRQTLEGRRRHRLSLNGDYLNYSNYREIVFQKNKDAQVTLELKYSVPSLPDIITDERLQRCFSMNEIAIIRESMPQFHSSVGITFGLRGTDIDVVAMQVTAVYGNLLNRTLVLEVAFEDDTHRGRLSPLLLARTHDNSEEKEIHLLVPFIDVNDWSYFFPRRINTALEQDDEPDWRIIDYLDLLGLPMLSSELVDKVHYIGPLRSEPKRAYPIQGDRVELDFKGENTLQILLDEINRDVVYINDNENEHCSVKLIDAVNSVLVKILEFPQTIEPKSFSDVFSQLMLPLGGAWNDSEFTEEYHPHAVTIADVGFGVSQVLPIIVAGLRADMDEILIVEQPEAHLHPRVQANLANFFVLLARLGKRVLVETHSEHLINGFREAIARDLDSVLGLHEKIHVVFVSQPFEPDRGSGLKKLVFDEYGYGMEWPPEFLPRSAVESQELLRLISEKRKHARRKLS